MTVTTVTVTTAEQILPVECFTPSNIEVVVKPFLILILILMLYFVELDTAQVARLVV